MEDKQNSYLVFYFSVLLLLINSAFADSLESIPKKLDNLTSNNSYIYPLMDARLSSKFGNRYHPIKKIQRHHSGIDLAAPESSPIRAMAAGLVVYADSYGGYGNLVVIEHPDGITSHYGHTRANLVKPGELVQAGQIIAEVGSTGLSTGPHLHLEIRKNGHAIDPLKFFPGLMAEAQG